MHFTGGTKCCILLRKGKEHFGGGCFRGRHQGVIYPPFCIYVKHFWHFWESLRIFWTTLLTNVKCGRDKDIACSFILPLAVNKEHLCGHSLDNPVPCSCLKCLSIFLVFSIQYRLQCDILINLTVDPESCHFDVWSISYEVVQAQVNERRWFGRVGLPIAWHTRLRLYILVSAKHKGAPKLC